MISYRSGAAGALLDEYERAIAHLKAVIAVFPDNALMVVTDPYTADENCRSLQTILAHVVHAGYGYATFIHNSKSNTMVRPDKAFRESIREYLDDLDSMFAFTETIFSAISDSDLEQPDDALKLRSGWGQTYDIEQMAEHAIVHVLRHRRQIEKIKTLPVMAAFLEIP